MSGSLKSTHFFAEAIQFEEQGERYQNGDRSQRNYERAAEMYGKAFGYNDKDADCVYNWQVLHLRRIDIDRKILNFAVSL